MELSLKKKQYWWDSNLSLWHMKMLTAKNWIPAFPPSPPVGGFGRAQRGNDRRECGDDKKCLHLFLIGL